MRFLQSYCVGIVRTPGQVKLTESNESFVEVIVQLEERETRNGGTHQQRIVFRSFDPRDIERTDSIQKGAIIAIEGNTDATVTERNGKWYGNPRVTGRILQLQEVAS